MLLSPKTSPTPKGESEPENRFRSMTIRKGRRSRLNKDPEKDRRFVILTRKGRKDAPDMVVTSALEGCRSKTGSGWNSRTVSRIQCHTSRKGGSTENSGLLRMPRRSSPGSRKCPGALGTKAQGAVEKRPDSSNED